MGAAHAAALVGRDEELAAITALLDGIGADRNSVMFHGEIGIGKTALLRAAVAETRARGFLVLGTWPSAQDVGLSFSGLADLLRDVADDAAPALPDAQRRALEVALAMRDPDGEPPSPLAVALAVRGVLSTLSEETPVVLAIDDAQWLDSPTLEALVHALRRLPGRRVALVSATTVESRSHGDPELLQGLAEDAVVRIRLEPLSRDAIGRLLRAELGLVLTGAELSRLHEACGGNPLFSLEVGRLLPPGGPRAGEPLPIPRDLADVVRRRLAVVPPDVRESLLVLAASADQGVRTGLPADALSAGVEAGILESSGDGVRFAHPIYASVLYADADEATRRALHRRLASLTEVPEERALHLALAADGPDAEAGDALESAAVDGRRRGAPSSGADLAEMAVRMTPGDRAADAARRSVLAAELHVDAGEFDRARSLLEDLLVRLPAGSQRAAVLQRLGWVRYHQDSWPAAAELYRDAAGEAGEDTELQVAIDLDTSVARLLSGDVQGAAAAARAALDRAGSLGHEPTVAAASAMVASVEFLLGNGIADDVVARVVDVETWSRPRPTMQHPSVAFGVLLKWADELDQARGLLRGARARAEEEGTERSLPFILFHLAELECWAGNWADAAEAADSAADIAERTGQDGGMAFALAAQAMVAALRGREDDARAAANDGLRLANRTGAVPATVMVQSVLGFLELSLGNPVAAHRHLGPLVAPIAEDGIYEPGAMRYLGDAIEALVGIGDLEPARRLNEELGTRSEELDRTWGVVVAARGRGLLLAATGELAAAEEALHDSLAAQERLGEPLERARTLLALGQLRRRDRQKRSARESLELALEAFQVLGAEQWTARAREELGRIGGRAPSTISLTPTEERIARAVAGGATNQEVAAELFLAVKTVEWNLSRIFRKLGIRNRAELVRWFDSSRS